MGFFKKYLKRYWKPFFLAIAFLTLETCCDLLQPTIMSKIIDVGVVDKKIGYIFNMTTLMLGVTALGAVGAVTRNILASNVSMKFGRDLRKDLYKKIQSLSFENIDKLEGASLVTRLTNDISQVQNFVNGLMRIFVKAPLLCVGSIFMATRLNFRLAFVFAIIVPVVGIMIFINMKIGYPLFIRVQGALDKVNGTIREYLSGVRVVKAFNRFSYEKDRFQKVNKEQADISIKTMRAMAVFPPSINFVINLGILSVLWFGGINVNNHNMQIGQIMAFINYMTQILFSMMMISFIFSTFVRARACAQRINEVFNEINNMEQGEILKANPTQKWAFLKGRIEFNKVSFSYLGTKGLPVLKDINFIAASGETIGIIGSTGSGKSTLVNLIPRFYDARQGSISFNGINVKNIEIRELRDKISLVPQKTVLFTGSVIDNIRWGKEEATLEEVMEATELARIHDFIASLPEGYNTKIGQGGVNFSGGQKQRLAIARALIKKPEILILDDCTSALDVETEGRIREAIKVYAKGLTCMIIAQRITSVMDTDKIIVLDNGEIAGVGKHKDLMSSCQVYKDIYHSQLGIEA
ncbi:MAG TPA: ABC transporter ATP-binding protein [Clostridiaceae bacterium]